MTTHAEIKALTEQVARSMHYATHTLQGVDIDAYHDPEKCHLCKAFTALAELEGHAYRGCPAPVPFVGGPGNETADA